MRHNMQKILFNILVVIKTYIYRVNISPNLQSLKYITYMDRYMQTYIAENIDPY